MSRVTLWSNRGQAEVSRLAALGARGSGLGHSDVRAARQQQSVIGVARRARGRCRRGGVYLRGSASRATVRSCRRCRTFSHEPSALRELLEQRDRAARAAPTSADMVGALGLAYHANMFYEEADRSYAIAEQLGGGAGADAKRVGLRIPGRTIARWCTRRAVIRTRRRSRSARVVAAAPDFSPAWWRLGEAEFKLGRHDAGGDRMGARAALPEPAPSEAPPRRAGTPGRRAGFGLRRAWHRTSGAGGRRSGARRKVLEEVDRSGAGVWSGACGCSAPRTLRSDVPRMPSGRPPRRPSARIRSVRRSDLRAARARVAQPDVSPAAGRVGRRGDQRRLARVPDSARPGARSGQHQTRSRNWRRCCGCSGDSTRRWTFSAVSSGGCPATRASSPTSAAACRACGATTRPSQVLRRAIAGLDDANNRYDLGLVLDRTGRLVGGDGRVSPCACPQSDPSGRAQQPRHCAGPRRPPERCGGTIRTAGRRRSREPRCPHQSRRDAVVDGAAGASRARSFEPRSRSIPATPSRGTRWRKPIFRRRPPNPGRKRLRFVDSRQPR